MIYIIGTHHRCGTVLMRNTFTRFCDRTNRIFFKGNYLQRPNNASFIQSSDSKMEELPRDQEYLGIHLYRDPYELLMSHIKYHQKTESTKEPCNFLTINGVLYKNHLKKLEDLSSKAKFEMDNLFRATMNRMLAWNYDNPRFLNINLNSFRRKYIEETASKIALHFNLDETESEILLKSFEAANRNKAVIAKHMTRDLNDLTPTKDKFNSDTIEYFEEKFKNFKDSALMQLLIEDTQLTSGIQT